MIDEEKQFDEIIRRKLDERSFSPSPESWEKAQKMIDQKRRKKFGGFWIFTSAAVVVASVLVITWQSAGSDNKLAQTGNGSGQLMPAHDGNATTGTAGDSKNAAAGSSGNANANGGGGNPVANSNSPNGNANANPNGNDQPANANANAPQNSNPHKGGNGNGNQPGAQNSPGNAVKPNAGGAHKTSNSGGQQKPHKSNPQVPAPVAPIDDSHNLADHAQNNSPGNLNAQPQLVQNNGQQQNPGGNANPAQNANPGNGQNPAQDSGQNQNPNAQNPGNGNPPVAQNPNANSNDSSKTKQENHTQQSNGGVNYWFAEIGANYMPGFSRFDKSGKSINPVIGGGFHYHLKGNFALQGAVHYTFINHAADSSVVYTSSEYSFGSTLNRTEIGLRRMHYVSVPVTLWWHANEKNSFFGGFMVNYLFTTESVQRTYQEEASVIRNEDIHSVFGYGQGLNRFDYLATAGYARNFGTHWNAQLSFHYGFMDLKQNAWYGVERFERNKGIQFMIQYSF